MAESLRINNTRVELTYSLVDEHGYLGTRVELTYSGVDEQLAVFEYLGTRVELAYSGVVQQGCGRFCLLHEKTTLGAVISYNLAFRFKQKEMIVWTFGERNSET